MRFEDFPKKELEKILEPVEELKRTPEWQRLIKYSRQIGKLEEAFNNRLWYRIASKLKLPDHITIHWLQNRRDEKIVGKLEKAILDYNNALKLHRQEHKVTPCPTYFYPEVKDDYWLGSRFNYKEEDGVSQKLVKDMHEVPPKLRRKILNTELINDRKTRNSLCGYCGEAIIVSSNQEDNKHFFYYKPCLIGIAGRVYVCGSEECTELAIANYLPHQLLMNEISYGLQGIALALIAKEKGVDYVTESQAQLYTREAYQKLVKTCTGGKNLGQVLEEQSKE